MTGANTFTVALVDGREVCYSYGVAVAGFQPGRGYFKTAEHYSVTTSRHANAYAGKTAQAVSAATFAELIAPLAVKAGQR